MSSSDDENKSNYHFFKYRNKLDDYKTKDNSQMIIPKFRHSINTNIKKSDFEQNKYSNQGLFNPQKLMEKFKWKKITEKENETIKFLEIMLKMYLKNNIQKLIEINRRRTYSFDLPNYKEKLKKIPIKCINYKNEIQKNGLTKLIFFPYKTFNIFYNEDVNKKLNLLEEYNSIKKGKKIDSNYEKNKNENDSDDSKDENYYFNIYNSSDITKNSKRYIIKKKRKIEIKDFIIFLESNIKTPMHRLLLQKAYIQMTLPKNNIINNNENENDNNNFHNIDDNE